MEDKYAAQRRYFKTAKGKRALMGCQLRKKYGISVEEYEAMKVAQDNKCAICGLTRRLVLDHNHQTGVIRKMLCYRCNIFVGYIEKNIEVLDKSREYLTLHE